MADQVLELRLPPDLVTMARLLAEYDGVSLEQWIARLIAQKIDEAGFADEFSALRAPRAKRGDMERILRRVPAREPMPGDEID